MAIKIITNEDFSALTGEYCYIQRLSDGYILENSATGGHTLGAFYAPATVTDKKLPLLENANLPGIYEAVENRVAFNTGKYVVRYCQADGTIIAVEEWNVVGDAVTDVVDSNVISQADIDFGALQKISLNAATPASVQNIPATGSGFTALGDTRLVNLDGKISDIPAAVWAVSVRTLSTFGTLVADIATAVWGAATRTLSALGFSLGFATPTNVTDARDHIEATAMTLTLGERTAIANEVE